MAKRRYRLTERATQQEATRRRIVEATAALHAEVGPAATSISAIAKRAGVQRLTVYRHFPDERELLEACGALGEERHPSPDPARWSDIDDPVARAEAALGALYAYYSGDARGLALVLRDAEEMPALRDVLEPFLAYVREIADDLADRWRPAGEEARWLRAAAGLAVDFHTWSSLDAQGLTPPEAAHLMAGLLQATATSRPDITFKQASLAG
jgi:AcrR family transcriptional regulator